MFITNEIEFEAAADQLESYLLIKEPSDEQKHRYSNLAWHMEAYVISQDPNEQTMH